MEKLSYKIFILTIFLGIIAVTSSSFLPFAAIKTTVIGLGIVTSLILYLINKLRSKSCDSPCNSMTIAGTLLVLSIIISTVLSINPHSSFFGKNFSADTGLYLLLAITAGYLSIVLIKTRDRIITVNYTLIYSFLLVGIFQILRLIFGTQFLSFGVLNSVTSTVLGSWFELGIFAGLVGMISVLTLSMFQSSLKTKIILGISILFSIIFLIITGFTLVWIALTVLSLVFVIKKFFEKRAYNSNKNFISALPLFSIIILIVLALFSWKGSIVTNPVVNTLKASYAEISLPWQYTLDIITPTVKLAPIFGIGPGKFSDAYKQFRPQNIVSSQYWSAVFPSGSSFILTSFVTQGVVGFIVWILILILLLKFGLKALCSKSEDNISSYTLFTTLFGSVYLWFMVVFYEPTHVTLLLTFVMTGLFVRELIERGQIKQNSYDWSQKGIKSLGMTALVVLAVLITFVGGIYIIKESVGQIYVQSAISVLNSSTSTDNTSVMVRSNSAKKLLNKSIWWNKVDTSYQSLANVDLFEVNTIIGNATTTPDTSLSEKISSLITEGVGYARTAESIDPSNVDNYIVEANIAQIATSLHIQNGYESAKLAYQKSLQLDPKNPAIYLALAKLDYQVGSSSEAFMDLNNAIQLKPNYTDAFFQAGLMSYNDKDYKNAQTAFTRAVQIDQNYANAIYFLGLTLIRLGNTSEATNVFTTLDKMFPNNQQITYVLDALNAGRSPFADSTSIASEPNKIDIKPSASSTSSTTTNLKKKK